jgi:hypothetical protein
MTLVTAYAKALGFAALPGRPSELDVAPRTRDDVAVDRAHLAAYDRVCGLRLSGRLPSTYVHVLAFPLALDLMTDRRFPFGVLGLVHIANRLEQTRAIDSGERLDLRVEAAANGDHERGRTVDVVAEARVDGDMVWRGVSTYLHRERPANGRPQARPASGTDEPGATGRTASARNGSAPAVTWEVPGDTGRRYAGVSGDRNPIHLHPLTARLFGMPRAIAHGMWVKARCLAALEGEVPDAHAIAVSFKRPLPLPGRATFASREQGDGRDFAVRDARSGAPHLTGHVGRAA